MNRVREQIGLTAGEWEALKHRLDCADALADVLEDEYAREDVEAVASHLASGDLVAALKVSTPITQAVLIDAVEGSTWIGVHSEESTRKENAAFRTVASLAKKMSEYTGCEVAAPRC